MIIVYLVAVALFVVYSYSQIDLNLTLLQDPIFLKFQQTMVGLGYYDRPLSTMIFLTVLGILTLGYFGILKIIQKNGFSKKRLVRMIVIVALISLFAYPAFSHDLFNYLYYPRVLILHQQNPYFARPLDFPMDEWTRFMHWTHEPYTYGPLFLALIAPVYLLGFGKFTLTLFLYKLFFVVFYLGNVWMIGKIAGRVKGNGWAYGAAIYALNPLVIIESLVSPHVDSVMTFFMLLGIFYFLTGKRWLGVVSFLFSGAIKYVTVVLLPVLLMFKPNQEKMATQFNKVILLSSLIMCIALVPVILQREANPWYLLPIIALFASLGNKNYIVFISALSIGLVLRYTPYLYTGDYTFEVQLAKQLLLLVSLLLGGIFYVWSWKKNFRKDK